VFAALLAYGVAEMYASGDSVLSGMATGLQVGGFPLVVVMISLLGAIVAANGHRVLLWLALATVPLSFLAVALAGAWAAAQSAG
jgi:nucleoside recognition membrane protein YjiH